MDKQTKRLMVILLILAAILTGFYVVSMPDQQVIGSCVPVVDAFGWIRANCGYI